MATYRANFFKWLKEKPYVFPWNRKLVTFLDQKCFACQNPQFCFLTQVIKISNRSNILAQKRSPEKIWKIKMQQRYSKMRWQKFLEILDCSKILNHKKFGHSVSTWKKMSKIERTLYKKKVLSPKYFFKNQSWLRNFRSKVLKFSEMSHLR